MTRDHLLMDELDTILLELATKWNSRKAEDNFYTKAERLNQAKTAILKNFIPKFKAQEIYDSAEKVGYWKAKSDVLKAIGEDEPVKEMITLLNIEGAAPRNALRAEIRLKLGLKGDV